MSAENAGERRPNARSYALAMFLGSTLLFLLEPIAAKRLVPLLGGSAAVWATCLVFFQTALLLGYYVAHLLVTRATRRTQMIVYVGLLGLSVLQLTRGVDRTLVANAAQPVISVLWLLCVLIGLPFVTLSATSPLLQAWFAREAPHGSAHVYRLFAVSNIGSIVALLGYPWLIEPRLTLRAQTILVAILLATLAIVAGAIGASVRKAEHHEDPRTAEGDARAPFSLRALWVALATCASLLLAATTTHISQNIAALPLIWIAPLVAYLLSFVIAFSTRKWPPRSLMLGLTILGLPLCGYLLHRGELGISMLPATAAFCTALLVFCLFLHGELYDRRPAPGQLTSYYFHVAAGGALGAVMVGIVTPLLLPGNYDLAIGLAFTAALGLVVSWPSGLEMRGVWSALVVAGLALIATQVRYDARALYQVRNFYGTVRVGQHNEPLPKASFRSLSHGSIVHGRQVYREDLRNFANTYYAQTSGVGLALEHCCGTRPRRIGVIGLGIGTVALYGGAADTIRFYEINPAIEDIARSYFSALRNSAAFIEVVRGDARVSLAGEASQRYDVLVVDAFSGDAIPAHLLTLEALQIYRRHLSPGGIVAFHVSNRFLNLAPVVGQLARKARMTAVRIDSKADYGRQVFPSEWVLVTANTAFVANPAVARAHEAIDVPAGLRVWTDDYSSLLPIMILPP